jgi:hypothetical protein
MITARLFNSMKRLNLTKWSIISKCTSLILVYIAYLRSTTPTIYLLELTGCAKKGPLEVATSCKWEDLTMASRL